MTIKEIRQLTNLSQKKFCEKYGIPLQTLCKWEQGYRTCPDYVVELLEFKVREDISMVSDEYVICPHCKAKHSKHKAIGKSGLVNYCGSSLSVTCDKCGKDFYCEYEVIIKYKTRKNY